MVQYVDLLTSHYETPHIIGISRTFEYLHFYFREWEYREPPPPKRSKYREILNERCVILYEPYRPIQQQRKQRRCTLRCFSQLSTGLQCGEIFLTQYCLMESGQRVVWWFMTLYPSMCDCTESDYRTWRTVRNVGGRTPYKPSHRM
jgi:hypothetical protein